MSTVMVHHPSMTQHTHTHTHTKLHTHLFCCAWQVEAHWSMVMAHHSQLLDAPPNHEPLSTEGAG